MNFSFTAEELKEFSDEQWDILTRMMMAEIGRPRRFESEFGEDALARDTSEEVTK